MSPPTHAVFGVIVADLIASPIDLKNPPPTGGLEIVRSIELTTGGNVPNVGGALCKLGVTAAGAGIIGRDALGNAILNRLRESGLDVAYVFASDAAPTSATVVAVDASGERTFFHVPGANALLDAEMFRRCFQLFATCDVVQIGYFGLLPALTPELPELLRELRSVAPHTKIALDTLNPPAARELLDPILPHVDIFCPSRPEATTLTGETEPVKMVASFRRQMPRGLIGIKLDVDGCYLDDGTSSVQAAAYPVEVVDTTGAGDVWFAGLLVALHHEMSLEQAARFANRAAADCCTAFGASAGVRSLDETQSRS